MSGPEQENISTEIDLLIADKRKLIDLTGMGNWRAITSENFPYVCASEGQTEIDMYKLRALTLKLIEFNYRKREFPFIDNIPEAMKKEARECISSMYEMTDEVERGIEEMVDKWFWPPKSEMDQLYFAIDNGLPQFITPHNFPTLIDDIPRFQQQAIRRKEELLKGGDSRFVLNNNK